MNGSRSKKHRAALRAFEAETKQTATMEGMGWRCTRRSRPEQAPRVYRQVGQPDKRTASVTWTAPGKWWLQWWQYGGGYGNDMFPTPVAAAMYLRFLAAQGGEPCGE